jgi:ABC-type sugar transport system ATPase subunit
VAIDLDAPCRRLTTAQQQIVEIAKALAFEARVIVMEEPSAALTSHEVARLFEIIRDLKKHGIRLHLHQPSARRDFHHRRSCDDLRDGTNVGERAIEKLTRNEMIEMMVGRELKDEFPVRASTVGVPRLEVSGLRSGRAVRDVSFAVRRGEILALTGLVGAGRTETVRLIFGADAREAGEIRPRWQPPRHPLPARRHCGGHRAFDRGSQTPGARPRSLSRGETSACRISIGSSNRGFVQLASERTEFGKVRGHR